MKRRTVSGKIGLVFGTFAPMHTGHIDLIQRAKRENDGVLVLVSGREDPNLDRGAAIGLGLTKRNRYAREVFADDPLVVVEKLDESDLPLHPNGWDAWTKRLIQLTEQYTKGLTQINIYVGEPEYKIELDNRDYLFPVPTTTHHIERSSINISATQIRNNPLKHWRHLTKPFRRHFTKKVLIIGAASGGKTTLCEDLARYYNAGFSPEWSRTYQATNNVRDDELDVNDFDTILRGQYQQTSQLIDDGRYQLIIADTNSSVTYVYAEEYLDTDSSTFKLIEDGYAATISREQWDLILLVQPATTYVDDGIRDMTLSDDSSRQYFTDRLIELIDLSGHKDKLRILTPTQQVFLGNYTQAKHHIDQILGDDYH